MKGTSNRSHGYFRLLVYILVIFAALSNSRLQEKGDFQTTVEATYKKVVSCLRLGGTLNGQYPLRYSDDLEAHYWEMINATAPYRGLEPHRGSGSYQGPWIENLFIEYFIGKPFSSFNGIVPLFVQWSDYHLHYRGSITSKSIKEKNEAELYLPFTSKIRKHVLYVVISQANYGLGFLARKYPNVLIFSAGGEGEVPIPLIKGELPYTEIDRSIFPKYDVSFLGSIDHGHRKKVLDNFIRLLDGTDYRYKMGPSKTWESEMALTMFNLAPIGMGRASFRLAEIIQLGRIPVYLYEDFPWSPYEDSGFGPADIGYVVRSNKMNEVLNFMNKATNITTENKLKKVREARHLYTYKGLLEQIEKWFFDPFGAQGGYLRCKKDDRKQKMYTGISSL